MPANLTSAPTVLSELNSLLHTLQSRWYQLWLGTWPTTIDWTGAVVNTHVAATLNVMSRAELLTDDPWLSPSTFHFSENDVSLYFAHIAAYYFGEDASALRNEAYDDMLWVVLSWLESIRFTAAHSQRHHSGHWYGIQHIKVFAQRAQVFYNLTTSGWDNHLCNGGMTWNPALEPYKNAVTNQLFIAASVAMYLYWPGDASDIRFTLTRCAPRDRRFLDAAVRGYAWLQTSNMTNNIGLFVDGYHISGSHRNITNGTDNTKCDDRNEMVYTYNQGIVLSALYNLFRSTGNASYLHDGHLLVNNTMVATGWDTATSQPKKTSAWHGLGRNGVMEEICDSSGTCTQDSHTFKSIYFHHLSTFCADLDDKYLNTTALPHLDGKVTAQHRQRCRSYTSWVKHNAEAALSTRDRYGRIGTWWGARDSVLNEAVSLHDTILLPQGAVDYKNDRQAMRKLRRTSRRMWTEGSISKHNSAKRHASAAQELMADKHDYHDQDLNDRGRGRTVESHVGGLAVLRCLWQLEQLSAE